MCDRLEFEVDAGGKIPRQSDNTPVAESDDLLLRAAKLLREHTGMQQGARITVDKRIPTGGGLGGGRPCGSGLQVPRDLHYRT